jgi:hypothetical protein
MPLAPVIFGGNEHYGRFCISFCFAARPEGPADAVKFLALVAVTPPNPSRCILGRARRISDLAEADRKYLSHYATAPTVRSAIHLRKSEALRPMRRTLIITRGGNSPR